MEQPESGSTERPSGPVIGYQRWDRILFLNWALSPEVLAPLIHPRLSPHTFEGKAYVTMTPFTLMGGRVRGLPPIPGASTFHELNVRTYVTLDGRNPGIWFFSLEAVSAPAVAAARATVGLPYFWARIQRSFAGGLFHYELARRLPAQPRAELSVTWSVEPEVSTAAPGSLAEFLVERYALYSQSPIGLVREEVAHPPWQLQRAQVVRLEQTVSTADGLPPFQGTPLALYSEGVDVDFFPPRRV